MSSKFDVEQAAKLLQNIEMIADIREIRVPKPDSNSLDMCTLKTWIQWLLKRVQTHGSFGIEKEFLEIIKLIDVNANILVERAKEGFQRLLSVIEEQDEEIAKLKQEVEVKDKLIDDLKDKLIEKFEANINKPEVIITPAPIPEPAIEEKPKRRPLTPINPTY